MRAMRLFNKAKTPFMESVAFAYLFRFLTKNKELLGVASLAYALTTSSKPEPDRELVAAKIAKEFERGERVFEIGSNKGGLTLLISDAVGPKGAAFSFEPNIIAFSLLKANCRAKKNVRCFNLGFGEFEGTGVLFTQGLTDKAASTMKHTPKSIALKFPVVTLDGFVRESAAAPDTIFIDAEGAELQVIKGGRGTIRSAGPRFILEIHGRPRPDMEMLRRFLADFGYHSKVIYDDGTGNVIYEFNKRNN